MPGGRTHDIITVVTAAGATPFTMALPGMTAGQAGVLASAYLVSGLLFSCDLDLHSGPYLRWGRFRFLWWPYQRLIHHRAIWSHGLVIGPALRIVYFSGVMYLLLLGALWLVSLLDPLDPTGASWRTAVWVGAYLNRHPGLVALSLVGFVLGGASHTIADVISTGVKHLLHRRRRYR